VLEVEAAQERLPPAVHVGRGGAGGGGPQPDGLGVAVAGQVLDLELGPDRRGRGRPGGESELATRLRALRTARFQQAQIPPRSAGAASSCISLAVPEFDPAESMHTVIVLVPDTGALEEGARATGRAGGRLSCAWRSGPDGPTGGNFDAEAPFPGSPNGGAIGHAEV
jgi:hypothetical protein